METIYFLLKVVGIVYLAVTVLIMIFAQDAPFFDVFSLIHYVISQRRKEKRNTLARSLWRVLPRATVVDKDIEGDIFVLICKSFFENPSTLSEDRVINTKVFLPKEDYDAIKIGDVVFLRAKSIVGSIIEFEVSKEILNKNQFMSSIMDPHMV